MSIGDLNYIQGDLLKSKRSIVHCVSADYAMGAGIAKLITQEYGREGIIKASKHGVGWKKIDEKYILYLTTKEKYWNKPTLSDMKLTLINLRRLCYNLHIRELAMPKIGCGLDRLSWIQVEKLITSEIINHGISVDIHLI